MPLIAMDLAHPTNLTDEGRGIFFAFVGAGIAAFVLAFANSPNFGFCVTHQAETRCGGAVKVKHAADLYAEMLELPAVSLGTARRKLARQIALHSDDVVRFLKPRSEFIVEVGLSPNENEMSPPPRPVICRLSDPRAVQPPMQRETGEEAVLTWLEPREPDPSHAAKSRLLREDLDVAEGAEQCDVLSSKIKDGEL